MIIIRVYDIKGKKLADSVSTIGSMLLFLLFLVCSLVIISGGASAYSRISDNYNETFSSSAAVRYISNKLRSGTDAEIYDNGKAVVIDCGAVTCVIYSDAGGLYEKYIETGETPTFTGGERIFENTDISVAVDGGLYSITAMAGDDKFSAYCRV